jgi:hypothetical protein
MCTAGRSLRSSSSSSAANNVGHHADVGRVRLQPAHGHDGLPIPSDPEKTGVATGKKSCDDAEAAVGKWMRQLVVSRVESSGEFHADTGGHTWLLRAAPRWSPGPDPGGRLAECFRFPRSFNLGDARFAADSKFAFQEWFDTEDKYRHVVAHALALRYTVAVPEDGEGSLMPRGVHRCSAVFAAVLCPTVPQDALVELASRWRDLEVAKASSKRVIDAAYDSVRTVDSCVSSDDRTALAITHRATGHHQFAFGRWKVYPRLNLAFFQGIRMSVPTSSAPFTPADFPSRFCTQLRNVLHGLDP